MKNAYNFTEYDIIFKNNKSHKIFILLVSIFLIGIIFIICRFKFKVYEKYLLIKNNEEYVLINNIENNSLITNNKTLLIDNKEYYYKINSIDEDYTNINNMIYQTIHISINYNKSNYTYAYILKENNTLLNIILKSITGGTYEQNKK